MKQRNLLDLALPYQRRFIENKLRRKIWIASRQVGKSWALAFALTYGALAGGRQGLSLCISTGQRAAAEIIKKCTQFAEAVKLLSRGTINYSASYDKITFSNGARVISLPSSADGSALRGWTVGPNGVLAIDEAAFIDHLDEILQAIGPTLTRNSSATLMLTTTPAGRNGVLYETYQQALNDPSWYVQTTTIYDAISDGLKTDLDALRSLCPDPEVFDQEYNCCFSKTQGSMLAPEDLVFSDEDVKGIYVFGMDIGRTRDKTSIVVMKTDGRRFKITDIVQLSNAEYQKQYEILEGLNARYRFSGGLIDQNGIGSAFAENVNRRMNSRFQGFTFTAQNKTPLYEQIRSDVFERLMFFAPGLSVDMNEQFRNVSRITGEDGRVRFEAGRSAAAGHSDSVSALALAREAARRFRPNASMPVQAPGFRSRF